MKQLYARFCRPGFRQLNCIRGTPTHEARHHTKKHETHLDITHDDEKLCAHVFVWESSLVGMRCYLVGKVDLT